MWLYRRPSIWGVLDNGDIPDYSSCVVVHQIRNTFDPINYSYIDDPDDNMHGLPIHTGTNKSADNCLGVDSQLCMSPECQTNKNYRCKSAGFDRGVNYTSAP